MDGVHDHPNTAFRDSEHQDAWIEIYHSRNSWAISQISFKKDTDAWVPFGKFKLIDASDIKPGFKAFRIVAKRLEFKFANRNGTEIDNNIGRNYVIESPGRYVVESGSGCRRVSDAQIADCLRAQRPKDTYVELMFNANPIWRNCYVTFCMPGEDALEWHKQQMELMEETGLWFLRFEAKDGMDCAFTDGNMEWDSNINLNYQIRLPGKYALGQGNISYLGPSSLDMHLQT